MSSSIFDRATIQACEIARGLDVSKVSLGMALWTISEIVVLLLDPTRKRWLMECSANTKGVWSIIEKEIDTEAGNSVLLGPDMFLKLLAFSEMEHRTTQILSLLPFIVYIHVCSFRFSDDKVLPLSDINLSVLLIFILEHE